MLLVASAVVFERHMHTSRAKATSMVLHSIAQQLCKLAYQLMHVKADTNISVTLNVSLRTNRMGM